MSTDYYYELDDGGIEIVVADEFLVPNTWRVERQDSDCLLITTGVVNVRTLGKICHSGPPNNEPVVTLFGASWESNPGDSGRAEAHFTNGCSPKNWTLIKKS